ncbi:MAG: dihydrodipicolinate reductase C-terminal domain-containing protein [Bacteroidales bacterium]|nr:dihydrodipicolinate reductase C-terminal domain-containing protein [Bacteroidales bacterium]
MKIGLLGYGRMGREIELAALAGGHEIIVKTDVTNRELFNPQTAALCDVAIEFTGPDAAADTILRALSYGVPVVSGSTGWLTRYDEVARYCMEQGGAFIHSSNYSIGVNVLFRLNAELARIMSSMPGYSVGIEEVHHTAKLDAPSGTAITLAGQITGQQSSYNGWIRAEDGPGQGRIPIVSVREGTVSGIHEVRWSSGEDTISLKHEALNRRGFATGALLAAGFISTRKGVFTLTDVLNLL